MINHGGPFTFPQHTHTLSPHIVKLIRVLITKSEAENINSQLRAKWQKALVDLTRQSKDIIDFILSSSMAQLIHSQ